MKRFILVFSWLDYERSHALLYSIHVLGMSTAKPAFFRKAIMSATPAPIVSLESVIPDGVAGFVAHKWAITFRSTECPEELQRSHMLRVTASDILTEMGVHHPRSSYRIPCRACLSIKHYRKDCKSSNPVQSAASFTTDVTVTQDGSPDLLAAPLIDA